VERVKVSRKFQIAVPAQVRRKLSIRAGDTLILEVRGRHAILLREPEDWADALIGLHREVWDGVDAQEYVRRLREEAAE
jgi:AbrB family looped-hinge helix DNA binding protein